MSNSKRERPDARETRLFFEAIEAGDLATVRQLLQTNHDLLFIHDDYYGSPVRAAIDYPYPEVADYLARLKLKALQEGGIPPGKLYGAIHDLGEAAHSATGYRGCEKLRAEAEPIVAGFLAHDEPQMRYIAISVLSSHWDLSRYATLFQQMSLNDPDEYVRQIALSAVGFLLRGTRDHEATRLLTSIFRDAGQPAWIREEAYEGLVEVWQGFDAAHALFLRKLRAEKPLRTAAEQAQTKSEKTRIERRVEEMWEGFVDWDFVAQVEREAKERGRS